MTRSDVGDVVLILVFAAMVAPVVAALSPQSDHGGVKMSDEDRLLLITCVSGAALLAVWFWIVW